VLLLLLLLLLLQLLAVRAPGKRRGVMGARWRHSRVCCMAAGLLMLLPRPQRHRALWAGAVGAAEHCTACCCCCCRCGRAGRTP
jgi:hypothetical protein